jgi:hypothetical protein
VTDDGEVPDFCGRILFHKQGLVSAYLV